MHSFPFPLNQVAPTLHGQIIKLREHLTSHTNPSKHRAADPEPQAQMEGVKRNSFPAQ